MNLTALEKRATEALSLPPFPLNLNEIRSKVELLLREVQRYGFFDEYTSHGFDHVDGMLKTAQWLIPSETLERLSPATCLFITLAIYFHDIGLLISKKEFQHRDSNPDFKRYLDELKSGGSSTNQDYMAKLETLDSAGRDKVLYSEFVRATHGSRVKAWVEGTMLDDDEASSDIRKEIQGLIGKLDSVARRDLALVCESHTIGDISDINKYKVSQPYGAIPESDVNLQYAAIVLRIVDLLQITNQRAPSILFKIISPTDPISQLEWQKQGAVRSVRASKGKTRDGQATDQVLSDTIEVHARFEKPDGFFGLTSYLAYAESQLALCQEALKRSERELVTPPSFPWKFIDGSNVEADGFLTEPFGFELDQQKILDLLTGHTLYNNTDVVIRELTQNALDAIRLQARVKSSRSNDYGLLKVKWNSHDKILEVIDNGTGMTQSVIQDHLLKVGSSRYQDPKFKESFPGFSSISRFGIGVLSAFMVADSVEITTCSEDEEKARQISLRSVHGKYLIKLLDKVADRENIGVYPHGSSVKLKLRSSADIGDILKICKTWLLFPRCRVEVYIDDEPPVKVGYDSPKKALEEYIAQPEFQASRHRSECSVVEVSEAGVTLAYVVERDELFKDSSFVLANNNGRYGHEAPSLLGMATAIEGVGVEFMTPGFKNPTILAIANLTGQGAPRTNVARSAIEDTNEYKDNLKLIYKLFAQHITSEIHRLTTTDEYSLSRAVEQAPFIASPLVDPKHSAARPAYLDSELEKVPFIILEETNTRTSISIEKLKSLQTFWTVNSPLISSVEFFVREAPGDISASLMLSQLRDSRSSLPAGVTMCNFGKARFVEESIKKVFEPVSVEADQPARRLTIKWEKIENESKWVNGSELFDQLRGIDRKLWTVLAERNEYRRHHREVLTSIFAIDDVKIIGLDGFGEFVANRQYYMHPNDQMSILLRDTWLSNSPTRHQACCAYTHILELIRGERIIRSTLTSDWLERVTTNMGIEILLDYMDVENFMQAVRQSEAKRFDPFAWKRRNGSDLELD
ncbi:molecular chaperone HtpG [Pseudomonas viridiflava]